MGVRIIVAEADVAVEIRSQRYSDMFLERHYLHVGRKIYPRPDNSTLTYLLRQLAVMELL